MAARSFTVTVRVLEFPGKHHVAVTELGGINVRGKRADDPAVAARNLFWELAGGRGNENDDAILAVDLAVEGGDLKETLKALGDGRTADSDAGG